MTPIAIICTARVRAPARAPRKSPLALLETPPGIKKMSRIPGDSNSARFAYHNESSAFAAYAPAEMPKMKHGVLPKIPLDTTFGASTKVAPSSSACSRTATMRTQHSGGGATLVRNSLTGLLDLETLQATATPFSSKQSVEAIIFSAPMSRNSTSRRLSSSTRRCCEATPTRCSVKARARSLYSEPKPSPAPKIPASGRTTPNKEVCSSFSTNPTPCTTRVSTKSSARDA
mmetsp:Transcript_32919/g.83558  ORF Transcript_32919/g.83558 Transcript_32919/m.83558 type:complete len:230 (+) Transcript_32919:402-1091(+)